ncbi:polycomb group protein FIE2 [Iris pallida]|uniref:Cysteine protease n=1 Tax=Iris pallida TaxID=29817 RepID=A0AAX6G9M9_IRIPA|nr:polycomb group protein FIE2 [Iris pallida]
MSFVGHGDSINEILTQALKPSLVISASKVFIASFHSNFVDYNRWLGDFILSKSVDSEIVPWKPKTMEQSPGRSVDILQKYLVPEYDIWFIKFKEGDISYLRSVRLTCEILYTSRASISLLRKTFTFPQSLGILGGKSCASTYMVEVQDGKALYLDPHEVQLAIELKRIIWR